MVALMKSFSISSKNIIEEAKKLWFEIEMISEEKNLFYVKWNWKEILFKSTDFGWNSSLWLKLCDDKELTNKVLKSKWLPVAKSFYLSKSNLNNLNENDLESFIYPLIVKPINEAHGNWLMMWILTYNELKSKLKKSFEIYDNIIIQPQIPGDEIRVLVVRWKVILAINRIPAYIIWNWKDSIKKLIENENLNNKLRWEWYLKPLSNIKIDSELIWFIEKNWFTLFSILKKWENIQLRWNSNIWTWWIPVNVINDVSNDIKEISIKAAKYLGLEICWVDILTSDFSKKLSKTWWVILEVNATPWIWFSKALLWINIAKNILDSVFN